MRRWALLIIPAALIIGFHCGIHGLFPIHLSFREPPVPEAGDASTAIRNTVSPGDTLFGIFRKNGLNMRDLFAIKEASANVYRLKDLTPGRPYAITLNDDRCVNSLVYWINDECVLKIERTEKGFQAEQSRVSYERRLLNLAGAIEDNFISSLGEDREHLLLALKISDIFAWDIDFASDLRRGDTYAVIVEGLYLGRQFRKYGEVLHADFVNQGKRHAAYRFQWGGKSGYFDAEGRSLRKAFLKAPLSFRRISSSFSRRRFHPVLRIYRPHRGVDYAAAMGTPVSATCDGTVSFAGRRGSYGKLVTVKHRNGYTTRYGHLSAIARGVRPGARVVQGDVIGYVGATGLASGPHLHYEMRHKGRFVNPLALKGAESERIPPRLMAEFKRMSERMACMAASGIPAAGIGPAGRTSTAHLSRKD